jgi:hypothetical protein
MKKAWCFLAFVGATATSSADPNNLQIDQTRYFPSIDVEARQRQYL